MKKLSLNIDELTIESFDVAGAPRGVEGTVLGHATQGGKYTCDPAVGTCFGYTCYETCANTCADTCNYTCDPAVGTCFGYTCVDVCF